MTSAQERPQDSAAAPTNPPKKQVFVVARVLLRAAASATVLFAAYYLIPLNHLSRASSLALLVIAIVAAVGVFTLQVSSVARSEYPGLRAIEMLATALPVYILSFALTYNLISQADSTNFSQSLTRTDALYFSVTVLSTVGFGDITPVTETARLIVTAQMLANLIAIGLGLRVVTGAVNMGRQRRSSRTDSDEGSP